MKDITNEVSMRFLLLSIWLLILSPRVYGENGSSVQWQGSGCPPATDKLEFVGETVDIHRDVGKDFRVTRGPKAQLRDSRKTCQALIVIAAPAGVQYAVDKISLTGEQAIGKADTLELKADLSFQGKGKTVRVNLPPPDPNEKTFARDHKLTAEEELWSGCGPSRALLVNIQQRISGGPAKEAAEAAIHKISLSLRLKKCD